MAKRLVDAANSIETCRSVLSQMGQHDAATALQGDLMDRTAANMAYGLLSAIPVYGTIAEAAKAEALSALELAKDDQTIEA